jgi:hypothetical protein
MADNEGEIRMTDSDTLAAPELRRKNQPCESCRGPVEGLGSRCLACLRAEWWRQAIARQVEYIRPGVAQKVTMARDRDNRKHIALFDEPILAFCQARVTTSPITRKHIYYDQLPADICDTCLEIFRELKRQKKRPLSE